jgi:hypothetical protein
MNVSVENVCCEFWRTQHFMIARYGRDRYWIKIWRELERHRVFVSFRTSGFRLGTCAAVTFLPTFNKTLETAVCRNPRFSSHCDSRITRHLGYKDTFCHSVLSANKLLVLMFPRNTTCLSAGLLIIGHVFSVCCKIVYRWGVTSERNVVPHSAPPVSDLRHLS